MCVIRSVGAECAKNPKFSHNSEEIPHLKFSPSDGRFAEDGELILGVRGTRTNWCDVGKGDDERGVGNFHCGATGTHLIRCVKNAQNVSCF